MCPGCKGPAKTAPAASAAQAAQEPSMPTGALPVKPMPSAVVSTSTSPPGAAPVKTLEVNPPASFAPDQLSEGGSVAFTVQAAAGQFLRLRVSGLQGAAPPLDSYGGIGFTLNVTPQRVGSPELESGVENCNFSSWLYALPQTGRYHVLFDPAGKKLGIALALLDTDDPSAGAGIRPEQVSVDLGELAKGGFEVVPYDLACGEGNSWPSHLAVHNDRFEMRIMPVSGYKAIFKDNSLSSLQAALEHRAIGAAVAGLPYPVYEDSGLNVATRPTFVQGASWRGLRWIAQYGQDFSCAFDELGYVFEGISNDDRFFILARARLSSATAGRRLNQDCSSALEAIPNHSIDELFKRDMPAIFDKDLAAADLASFQPGLDQLDGVIRSLKLRTPK